MRDDDQIQIEQALIEQAKGIIMAGRRCTAEEAVDVLLRASVRSNRSLAELATRLVGSVTRGPRSGDHDRLPDPQRVTTPV